MAQKKKSTCVFLALAFSLAGLVPVLPQESGKNPSPSPPEKTPLPFQIQLLETRLRFEANGDWRKEVHTIVKLRNAVGAQEFSRIAFDYSRPFQQVEIPMVRVVHGNGGISDVLPSAVTDAPNPAVESFPAYQDVRIKSARVLGLQEGDTVEYRVVTTTSRAPLAPNFWLEHSFDRSGEVLEENYEVDLPAAETLQIRIRADTPAQTVRTSGDGKAKRTVYQWKKLAAKKDQTESSAAATPDVAITTFRSWEELASQLNPVNGSVKTAAGPVERKASELSASLASKSSRLAAYYEFVRSEIKTVSVPLAATGFRYRAASEVLASGYGNAADKFVLLQGLAASGVGELRPVFVADRDGLQAQLPIPTQLTELLATVVLLPPGKPGGPGRAPACTECDKEYWLDMGLDVAPFGMVRAGLRGRLGLRARKLSEDRKPADPERPWHRIPDLLPFAAKQNVSVAAAIDARGQLTANVKYTLRGDNELLLREAFHETSREKWKDVAGLLALSDGFRGVVTSVNASDPMSTRDPFAVEYELKQENFVDWSKKPVRIPALLPQIGLPDGTERAAGQIELGTPLDVETQVRLQLPAGTTVETPAGTAVQRDYATYSSQYGQTADALTALRHIRFLRREIAGDRAFDYNAFLHAVQNDQAQYFVLDRGVGVKAAAAP